ncbi:ankyrin repeat domain-containing protein SOWAHD [Hyperolius riggenbachi]|uniref:ankyrin repeat domain-containing protein SOWAHD n=1 Tax=Hyperolius riggenbachi TaxID=752182 RepID=UPI0035A32BF7
MNAGMEPKLSGWKGTNKLMGKFKLPRNNSSKELNQCEQGDAALQSCKMRDSRSVRRVESLSRTPSPATISKRKRGMRGSLWSTTGSLPLVGAWFAAAGLDSADDQDQQQDFGESGIVLDPVEHAWMLMVAEGNFDEVQETLQEDPSLLYRRDFVTGYSLIHWLAKHGHHEDLIRLMDFSNASGYLLDINSRASGGLTPLHIAALQGHAMVIKVLVGAFNADVHIRDHNGRKAWQYLRAGADSKLLVLLGAPEEEETGTSATMNNNNNRHIPTNRSVAPLFYDETDHIGKMTMAVAPLRNLFKSAYGFLKKW